MHGIRRWAIGPLMVALMAAAWAGSAKAQEMSPPPLPIIYQGEVFFDQEPVQEGKLTGRVGDWESDTVPVLNGTFRCADPCLLIGPPSASYVGQKVTFHLQGVDAPAAYSFEFPNLMEPRFDTVQLFFGAEPGNGLMGFWIGAGGVGTVLALTGFWYFFLRAKRKA